MATQGIMKTEIIPFPSKKVSVTSTVKEIKNEQVICKLPACEPYVELDDRIICALPPAPKFDCELEKAKIFKEFECEYPSTEPNVNRITYPLPFPNELEEVIGWADAFVDRVASLTAARKAQTTKDMQALAKELKRLDAQLAKTEVALHESQEETRTIKTERDTARSELAEAKVTITTHEKTIASQKSELAKTAATEKFLHEEVLKFKTEAGRYKKELEVMTKYRNEAVKVLQCASAEAAKEHARFEEANKLHNQDHKALEEEHVLFNKERDARKAAETQLKDVKQDLDELTIKYGVKEKVYNELKGRFDNVKAKLDEQVKRNSTLKAENDEVNKKLREALHDYEEAKKKIADLKAEDNKNKAAICELNTKLQASEAGVETLKKQNTLLIKEKDAALVKAAGLQNDLDAAKKDMEENQKELEKARADATKFENDLKECEGLRDGLRSDLTHVKGDLLRVRKELAEAWEDNAKAGSLTEAEIAGYTRAGQISPSRLIELEGYEKKAKELETKLAAAEKVIIPIPAGKKLNILSVEYGGQAYQPGSKQAIIDKLYKHAADGTEFTITNDFFGGDPWHGQTKSFSITYLLEGENVVHHLYGLEKKSFRFCPNRK